MLSSSVVYVLFAGAVAASNVTFFLSTVEDSCSRDGVSMPADQNTADGSLCAFDSDAKKIWACPAPSDVCWGWAEDCKGKNSTTPASNQLACPSGGETSWCCDLDTEVCTETENQINICWAKNITNPNAGVPPDAASSIAAASFAAQSSAALQSRLSALATPVSTLPSASGTITASSTTTAAGISSPNTSTQTSRPQNSNSSGISGGGIAGVVVGTLGGVAIISVAAVFIWRRSNKKMGIAELQSNPYKGEYVKYKQEGSGFYEMPPQQYQQPQSGFQAPTEMGSDSPIHEMPTGRPG